jgi:2,3-bisphosphoglycerate-independent phosphoglycerate mutase
VPAVLVFIDGVGIGDPDPSYNPLARTPTLLSQFNDGTGTPLPRDGVRRDLDATLGVPGRPQSATGQTALITGENAPALLGKHLLGFPNATLRALLEKRSIFHLVSRGGGTVSFLNGYPVGYLDAVGLPHRPLLGPAEGELSPRARRLRPAAAPLAYAAAGGLLSTFDDVRAGTALCHDLTNRGARLRGWKLPLGTPEDAAQTVARQARSFSFCMFDYFLTDDAGHAQDFAAAAQALGDLDRFLRRLLEVLPLERVSLFVASDHGNLEDLRRRNHTTAKVPLLVFGPARLRPLPGRIDGVMSPLLAAAEA